MKKPRKGKIKAKRKGAKKTLKKFFLSAEQFAKRIASFIKPDTRRKRQKASRA